MTAIYSNFSTITQVVNIIWSFFDNKTYICSGKELGDDEYFVNKNKNPIGFQPS